MDFIQKTAERFVKYHLSETMNSMKAKKTKEALNSTLYELIEGADEIKFLHIVLEAQHEKYKTHLTNCTKGDDCDTNFNHEDLLNYIRKKLSGLGVQLSEDTFSIEEKESLEEKLDKILQNMEELKSGQQVIYEDLTKELEELKGLFYLGRKNWHQLLTGKIIEMTASGIISETVSKSIIQIVKDNFPLKIE